MLRSLIVSLCILLAPLAALAQGLSPRSMTESRLNVLNNEMQGKVIEARQAFRAGLEGANACDENWVREAQYRLDKLRQDAKAKEQQLVELREEMHKNHAKILKKLAELIPGFEPSAIGENLKAAVALEIAGDIIADIAKDSYKGIDTIRSIDNFEKEMGKAIKRDQILDDAVHQELEIQLAGIMIDAARDTQKEISALIEKLNQQWDTARASCKKTETVGKLGGDKPVGGDVAKGNVVVVDKATQRPIPGGKVVKIPDDPKTVPEKPKEGDNGGKVTVGPLKPIDEFVFDFPCHGMITLTGADLIKDGPKVSLDHKPLKLTFVGYKCGDVTKEKINEQLKAQYNVAMDSIPEGISEPGSAANPTPQSIGSRFERSQKGKDFPVCEVTVLDYQELPKETPKPADGGLKVLEGMVRWNPRETPKPADDGPKTCVPGIPLIPIPENPFTPKFPGGGGIVEFPWDPGIPLPYDPMTPFFPKIPGTPGVTEHPGGTVEKFVEGDVPIEGQGPAPNDPLSASKGSWGQPYADQWWLKAIGWLKTDGTTVLPARATPVTVAVIDTGIDRRHPELLGALWTNPNASDDGKSANRSGSEINGWNFINNSSDITDRNGHGTVVAGIIAALPNNNRGIAGINPWARIMVLKVTNHANKGGSAALSGAIMYAADNGARVINLSVGGKGRSNAVQTAIDYAARKGVLVVVASGNQGIETTDFFPGGARNTLTVAATGPDDKRTNFSNWGSGIGVAAPGVDILSLRARGTDLLMHEKKDYKSGTAVVNNDYYRVTGSSFSAPIVSGVASLLFSINPNLTAEQVRRMIVHSARDIDVPGKDQFTGYGLLDAGAAVAADPNFHLVSNIASVEAARASGRIVLRVKGSASANDFKSAWLEAGPSEDTKEWRPVSGKIVKPLINGLLADLDPSSFKGEKSWVLRLVVEHGNGRMRESRYSLSLE